MPAEAASVKAAAVIIAVAVMIAAAVINCFANYAAGSNQGNQYQNRYYNYNGEVDFFVPET